MPSNEQAWRHGRTPYLEKVVSANLSKIGAAMRCLQVWACQRGLKPFETERHPRKARDATDPVDHRASHAAAPAQRARERRNLAAAAGQLDV